MRNTLALLAAGALLACASGGAQAPQTTAARPDAPVQTAHPYEVKGKVKSTGGILGVARSVTIVRDGAPTLVLHVADGTKITLNDKPAHLSDLREGDDVRALFDFEDSSPVAIDVDVKKGH